ncbi:hypothetical protein LTR56_016146 [Elasticomyces elasticus]|nr:hypothetical protein LTR56_016146 [Elasticomyces elasticus]KAK3637910.1 hypothetical protein LTR22_018048 [Elasticomyces elasticus]KAK4908678.1 hypothetical protein LTR49_022490 [Elasticomyces elasticus]KAK5762751.1 hypothetical protein LTS12_007140 [Elasticomyces elasticus]
MPTKNRFTTTQSPSNKTAITLNIYDLLPPGPLSTLLWTLGSSLLHSGVQITPPSHHPNQTSREYAYGGHNRPNIMGVYYTPPLLPPPGSTFRTSLLVGYTNLPPDQINAALHDISNQFLGTSYNLLTNNCNHFSSALLHRLTGRSAPRWLNRAAGVGLAIPCMVPKEWVGPPLPPSSVLGSAEGELLSSPDLGEDDEDEEAAMLDFDRRRQEREQRRRERGRRSRQASAGNIVVPERSEAVRSEGQVGSVGQVAVRSGDQVRGGGQEERGGSRERGGGQGGGSAQQDGGADEVGSSLAGGPKITGPVGTPPPRVVSVRDMSGRAMPVAERAPVPAKLR